MRQALVLHAASTCTAVAQVEAEVVRANPDCLELRYIVTGKMSELCLPPVAAAKRGNDLWRHTCFEMFIRAAPNDTYHEFNFSPSMQWAAYRFDAYRSGMRAASEINTPEIDVGVCDESCALEIQLNLQNLPDLPSEAPWLVGLSAVIEETNGRNSYWALAHPPGKPDFHHADCFALQIPAA